MVIAMRTPDLLQFDADKFDPDSLFDMNDSHPSLCNQSLRLAKCVHERRAASPGDCKLDTLLDFVSLASSSKCHFSGLWECDVADERR
jgi:hypothetical protein